MILDQSKEVATDSSSTNHPQDNSLGVARAKPLYSLGRALRRFLLRIDTPRLHGNKKMTPSTRIKYMSALPSQTRNRLRAILALDGRASKDLLSKLRSEKDPSEILILEKVLRYSSWTMKPVVASLFPATPQSSENYERLANLGFIKELQLLDLQARDSKIELTSLIVAMSKLNQAMVEERYEEGDNLVEEILKKHGYSHVLARKAALIHTNCSGVTSTPAIDKFLRAAGLENKNIVMSSLIHCYKEEQDFLSLKRSIMGLPDRGSANRFTRDACRIPFHPLAKDENDLAELIQSWRQSSLIDAVLGAKINVHLLDADGRKYPNLRAAFGQLDLAAPTLETLAGGYDPVDDECEMTFYKQSSAWLENSDIIRYRFLIDHFYDYPEAEYFNLNDPLLLQQINIWSEPLQIDRLAVIQQLSRRPRGGMTALEKSGSVTRSALFNYSVSVTEGFTKVDEASLITIMSSTRDLSKTSSPRYLTNMAKISTSKTVQLLLYLLIAKKSKNELDDHRLRRIFQEMIKTGHGGSVVGMFDQLNKMSRTIAEYAYEICTEDFIAKLFHIINSASEITETRASLHKWMGQLTGEKVYLDRARTLLIDHQLNKIRNEIDDNRIYVDAARFVEWMNDEVVRDLNGILTRIEHQSGWVDTADPQIIAIVERCYLTFCSSKIFGIASYLGRRIRHGTFKGHLFSSVVAIERRNEFLSALSDPAVAPKWIRWKAAYEKIIDDIIVNRLHIVSPGKHEGLLRPGVNTAVKMETLAACARNLVRDFLESNSSSGAPHIITEYCWRLADFDLKDINTFLKGRRSALVNADLLTELKTCSTAGPHGHIIREFTRDLTRLIDDKLLSMYNWFKKPANVAPQASLSLLYKAVVAEVQQTFPDFVTDTEFDESGDIRLIGGAYHVWYDSFFVVVYNAAKHGKICAQLERKFELRDCGTNGKLLIVTITSTIKDSDNEEQVANRLSVDPDQDFDDAQVSEDRSGIRKLHFLAYWNKDFAVEQISCFNRRVSVTLTHILE